MSDFRTGGPIKGKQVQFQFLGDDGEWHPLEEVSMQKLNIDTPNTEEVDAEYAEFLAGFINQKIQTMSLEVLTAQEELVLHHVLFNKDFEN